MKHLFALFVPSLSNFVSQNGRIVIADPELAHRLNKILRLRIGENVILFDDSVHMEVLLIEYLKDAAVVAPVEITKNVALKPQLTVFLGLAKKPAFEDALYSCAALGVQCVVPLLAGKIERNWFSAADLPRLTKIIVAAREQAKNFAPLQLQMPTKIEEMHKHLSSENVLKIVFEVGTTPIFDCLSKAVGGVKQLAMLIGPEAGLSEKELALVGQQGFFPCSLVATTLRVQEATTIGVGVIRSYFK